MDVQFEEEVTGMTSAVMSRSASAAAVSRSERRHVEEWYVAGAAVACRAGVLSDAFSAFEDLGVEAEPVVYADDAVDEVREQLRGLDGVLVWVNPIQDGANRGALDELLREVSGEGRFVSADPDVIKKMGTKAVLHRTKDLGWGTDTDLYESAGDFAQRFPVRLAESGVRVLKQGRGNGGNGVWKVALLDANAPPGEDVVIRVQHAETRDAATQDTTLGEFIARSQEYFAWSGVLIDQPFQSRLADGMVRCYLVHDEVVGFQHQSPRGLLDAESCAQLDAVPPVPKMEDADTARYGALRSKMEREWVPQMQEVLGIGRSELPVIWDADFLYGERDDAGNDTYVLCEINVSAVWPFPPQATRTMASAAAARLSATRS
jgi:hypothetical protein